MGKLQVNGAISATGTISASSFLGNLDWSYITNKPNFALKRNNASFYVGLGNHYPGGTTPTYYRITLPDSQLNMYGMYTIDLLVDQSYGSGYGGKIIIQAYHNNSTMVWNAFQAYVDGTLTTDIKIYGSDGKYFYISGCSAWGNIAIENMIVADSAINVDLTNTTIDIVTSLPSTYQTATMSYGLSSTNYTSYTVTKTGGGASGTWGINVTGSAGSVAWGNVTGKPSTFTPSSHTHDYLPLSGGTMTGSPVIKFPASAGSIAASDPMAITYGRISAYGTLCINANTDNSGTEYVILTAGKGLSSSTSDGLAIGSSTLTWQGSTVLTTGNFPSSSSLARQTDIWISAASLDVNTYYPVVISLPANGLNRIKLAVQLNSSTRPSWSTHNGGFTSNIDVEIIQAGWGTVNPFRYLLRQDDYGFASVKPAYFAGQLSNASLAVFYVRGGGSYRFICDWADASISLRTSSTTYNDQTVAPTTSASIFHAGTKSHLYCNVDYAASAGSAGYLPSYTEYSSTSSLDGFLTDGVLRWAKVNSAALAFGNDGSVISVGWGGGFGSQVWLDDGSGPAKMAVRNRSGGSSWNGWRHCIMSCSETYYGGSLPSSANVGDVFFKT